MLSATMQDAINHQINRELYSAYLYASMTAYCRSVNLEGFANWVSVQAREELFHAQKFISYINDRRGRVFLEAIEKPPTEWGGPGVLFDAILTHEINVTKAINNLVALAAQEKDTATETFLQWYVTEQVEEEANVDRIIARLKLVEGLPGGIFMIDNELAARVYTDPSGSRA